MAGIFRRLVREAAALLGGSRSRAAPTSFPLHEAVLRADEEEVARLLSAGSDPNAIDAHGMTPLIWAVYGGYTGIVELLCRAGADIDLREATGETALWHAEDDFGLHEIAAVLRRFGAKDK